MGQAQDAEDALRTCQVCHADFTPRRRGNINKFCSVGCYRSFQRRDRLAERFWGRVRKGGPAPQSDPSLGGCWIWTGHKSRSGYGYTSIGTKNIGAHVVGYMLSYGAVPDGHVIRHTCDVKLCVRHVTTGTPSQNSRDSVERGLTRRGDDNPMARLSEPQVREIISRHRNGERGMDLAAAFGTSRGNVSRIVNRKNWKHLA